MALIDFVRRAFGGNTEIDLSTCSIDAITNIHYKTLAVEASINLIAKTLARAEFQTFYKGAETKKTNYYLLNVEANQNKSSSLFWRETVEKLLKEGDALILIQDNHLYLADSFTRKEYAFYENVYTEIKIADYELNERKTESEVIYLKNDNAKIKNAIEGLYGDYVRLISASVKGYSGSKSRKGILEIPTSYPKTLKEGESLQEHISNLMRDFMDSDKDAVFPQTNGLKYEEIDRAKGSKSNDSGRETKNFVNDVFDFVGMAYGIPPSLLKGDTVDTKDAVNNFLTFCINPLAKLIQDEINRKMYGQKEYLKNSYVKVDTTNIKAVDLKDIANSIDLLNRNGALTIDDTLRILGKEPVGGEIGSMRFITKNLELLDAVLREGSVTDLKGGD